MERKLSIKKGETFNNDENHGGSKTVSGLHHETSMVVFITIRAIQVSVPLSLPISMPWISLVKLSDFSFFFWYLTNLLHGRFFFLVALSFSFSFSHSHYCLCFSTSTSHSFQRKESDFCMFLLCLFFYFCFNIIFLSLCTVAIRRLALLSSKPFLVLQSSLGTGFKDYSKFHELFYSFMFELNQ
ncbi:hypothetical protein VNO77_02601 [Canavalia gladiata]|uniref:Transmembrane protein n=1 Tax=Canavalia gladiata TaxID=3824 RepID=A0AAN9MYU2_CANGL